MNRPYAFAAFLSLLAAIIRTWDGETEVLEVARASGLDATIIGFFHLTWYMVTIVFVISAGALGLLASRGATAETSKVGLILGLLFLAWSLCIVIVSSFFVWHPGTAIPMVVTFLIGMLAILGSRSTVPAVQVGLTEGDDG